MVDILRPLDPRVLGVGCCCCILKWHTIGLENKFVKRMYQSIRSDIQGSQVRGNLLGENDWKVMFERENDGISKNINSKLLSSNCQNRECKQPNRWEIKESEMDLRRSMTSVSVGAITQQ